MDQMDIYPLSSYYFCTKDAVQERTESFADRTLRFKSNFEAHGLRICVYGVLVVELLGKSHVLLLQVKNSFFKLPGGRLRPHETDAQGLNRKLSRDLSSYQESSINDDWQIDKCIGTMWRSEFDTSPLCYNPTVTCQPKECIKLFLIRLQMSRQFVVPKNFKLLAVPLFHIRDNSETYGPIISKIPYLLSNFSFNTITD
ncbi:hypothetical protein LUZ60_013584 [Juncus effusus]|nr:hypothetical protein LUZ60_013584 [Juncus effusus]